MESPPDMDLTSNQTRIRQKIHEKGKTRTNNYIPNELLMGELRKYLTVVDIYGNVGYVRDRKRDSVQLKATRWFYSAKLKLKAYTPSTAICQVSIWVAINNMSSQNDIYTSNPQYRK